MLATGTNMGWVRVYDTRKGNNAEINVMAHTQGRNKKVRGIRCDPFNSQVIATFSDVPNEAVKVRPFGKRQYSNHKSFYIAVGS